MSILIPYFQENDDDEVEELEPPSLHEDYYKRQDTLKKFIKIVTENSQKDSKFHDQLTIELNEVTRNYSELKDKYYSIKNKAKQIKEKAVVIGNENTELKSKNKELDKRLDEALKKNDEADKKIQNLEQKMQTCKDENKDLCTENKTQNETIIQLEKSKQDEKESFVKINVEMQAEAHEKLVAVQKEATSKLEQTQKKADEKYKKMVSDMQEKLNKAKAHTKVLTEAQQSSRKKNELAVNEIAAGERKRKRLHETNEEMFGTITYLRGELNNFRPQNHYSNQNEFGFINYGQGLNDSNAYMS